MKKNGKKLPGQLVFAEDVCAFQNAYFGETERLRAPAYRAYLSRYHQQQTLVARLMADFSLELLPEQMHLLTVSFERVATNIRQHEKEAGRTLETREAVRLFLDEITLKASATFLPTFSLTAVFAVFGRYLAFRLG